MPKTRDDQTHRRKQILNILNDSHVRVENLDQLLAFLRDPRDPLPLPGK